MSEASHTLDEEQVPATPQLCMQTVQDYRRDKLSKVTAVRDIFAAFRESEAYANTSQDDLDSAIGTYVAMLDQHDASRQTSALRGSRTRGATDGEDEEDLVGTVGDKRPRPDSPVGQLSANKRVPDESLFAWLGDESAEETLLTPSQELTRKMVQNQTIDLKATKRRVLSAKRVPEFPDMEWNNILAGKAVNLDVIFSGMYSTASDNKTIENLGDLELHFGVTKPAKSVETHGDWVIAWRIALTATKFIFPHRARELKEYSNYISSYFASVQLAGHSKIFNHLEVCQICQRCLSQ